MEHIDPLSKAIEIVGLRPLAAKLNISYQAIQKFQKTRVPSEQVLKLSEATKWGVTPHEFRPDIYPHPHDGLPEHLRKAEVASFAATE